MMEIEKIYLSETQEGQELDYDHLNTEVIVHFRNGDKYSAHLISFLELESQFQEKQAATIDFEKKYFWSESLVIVKDIKKQHMLPMIEYMIDAGDFQLIFKKL